VEWGKKFECWARGAGASNVASGRGGGGRGHIGCVLKKEWGDVLGRTKGGLHYAKQQEVKTKGKDRV